jgi:hypothetical protein
MATRRSVVLNTARSKDEPTPTTKMSPIAVRHGHLLGKEDTAGRQSAVIPTAVPGGPWGPLGN